MSEDLDAQLEQMLMMQRVDRELSTTLNTDNVVVLTIDWALRRTKASAGLFAVLTPDGSAITVPVALGYDHIADEHGADYNPFSINKGIIGRAIRKREVQVVPNVRTDPDYDELIMSTRSLLVVPVEMWDRILGAIMLESNRENDFSPSDVVFVQWLASRAAVALDNARLYREAEQRADELAVLYAASRSIASSIERTDVLSNAAQAVAASLSVSGSILADLRTHVRQLVVTQRYRLGTARNAQDILPEVGTVYDLTVLPEFHKAMNSLQMAQARASDEALSPEIKRFLSDHKIQSLIFAPLADQGTALGAVIAVEGRRERRFNSDEILMFEALVSQIASALRQSRLFADVRELEHMKSEMIRMASHDLRNPLNNAIGYMYLLSSVLGDNISPRTQEYMQYIQQSLGSMGTLLEDLLTLERIESERQASWTEIDLRSVVRDVMDMQQPSASMKGHTVTVIMPPDAVNVLGSFVHLRQALTNLVGNAIKYTPNSGTISVRVTCQDVRAVFEVKDNGYGISKEKQERLFQRFFRAKERGTEEIGGTGLGLSLVKAIVERHGGEVTVRSELGVGSTFGFWLPLSEKPEKTIETPETPSPSSH
jgi:signal transduction histidine kinase